MNKIGVYKITSPSKRIYIGSSKNIEQRFLDYKKLRCKTQVKLYNSFIKHGVQNHEFKILIECEENELFQYENLYSNYYKSLEPNNLNLRIPSYLDKKNCVSNESIEKMKLNHPSKTNPEWKKNLIDRLKKQSQTIEWRQKISKSKKGVKNKAVSEYNKNLSKEDRKLRALKAIETKKNKNNGEYHTDEFKEKMSKRLKGVKLSELHKQKLKENHGTAKKVICTSTNLVFNSAFDAAKYVNMNAHTLYNKLIGRRKNETSLKYLN
jgi:group I intron endonuclease